MTLTIHTEEDEQRQLILTIAVPEADVQKAMRQAARKLAGEVRIPGFRKGKAPYSVIANRIGKKHLRDEAIEKLMQPTFEEAMQEIDLTLYAQPNLENIEPEPLVYTFTVPLKPVVTLDAAYRDLRKEVEAVEISDEAVNAALEQVRVRHQEIEPVERAVENGDIVSVSGKGVLTAEDSEDEEADGEETAVANLAGNTLFNEEKIDLLMDNEVLFPGTPFVENIIGLSAGDDKSFTFSFPDDFDQEDLAGREASFEITVLDIKSRILPELDDALAQQEGDYESLADLRDSLRKNLKTEAESAATTKLIEDIVDDLLEKADVVYPPAALEFEIDGMVKEMKAQMERSDWQWEDYLKMRGLNEETVRDTFRENAAERLTRRQVLQQFVTDEKLTVEVEDVDVKIEERLEDFGDNKDLRDSMRQYFSTGAGFDVLSNEILIDKIAKRGKEIYAGEAPDLAELEAANESTDEEE